MNLLDLMDCGTLSGKTSPESYPQKTTPLAVSWQRLSEQTTPSIHLTGEAGLTQAWLPARKAGQLGAFSTLNTSDWPNDAAVCSLSQILEMGPIPQRFYLSARACAGIIRRAEKRGKELPEQLQQALKAVATNTTED